MNLPPALANPGSQLPATIPSEHEMMVYHTMAEQAVTSKMYRGIGDKSGIMMIMLAARELGIPPMQALNGGINIINGKAEISARMMNALIRKAGHSITVKESTDISCTVFGRRCDNNDYGTATYTVAEAQKAGLVKTGGGWTKNPKDMCFARALSRLSRQLFSDVIGIGYVEGEIRAIAPENAGSMPIALAEEIAIEQEVVESEADWTAKYLEIFDKEEHADALAYLKKVAEHFQWDNIQAIKELLKDEKRLFVKYRAWKKTLIKVVEQ